MPCGAPWPEEHQDLLRRCVEEKGMPVKDCARVMRRSEASVRAQMKRLGLETIPPDTPEPDWDFFEKYGTADSPNLKVV